MTLFKPSLDAVCAFYSCKSRKRSPCGGLLCSFRRFAWRWHGLSWKKEPFMTSFVAFRESKWVYGLFAGSFNPLGAIWPENVSLRPQIGRADILCSKRLFVEGANNAHRRTRRPPRIPMLRFTQAGETLRV